MTFRALWEREMMLNGTGYNEATSVKSNRMMEWKWDGVNTCTKGITTKDSRPTLTGVSRVVLTSNYFENLPTAGNSLKQNEKAAKNPKVVLEYFEEENQSNFRTCCNGLQCCLLESDSRRFGQRWWFKLVHFCVTVVSCGAPLSPFLPWP